MTTRAEELDLLQRGLGQASATIALVQPDDLDKPTPCTEWTVADLVDHLAAAPVQFAQMLRGEQPDFSAPTPHLGEDRTAVFDAHVRELTSAWEALGDSEPPVGLDWQLAEISVHTADLAVALGRPTAELDGEVAERGLAFMRANLTTDNRRDAFAPETTAPDGADPYEQIAAFAGRSLTPSR